MKEAFIGFYRASGGVVVMKDRTRRTQKQTKAEPYKEPTSWWIVGIGVGAFLAALIILGGQARADQVISSDMAKASEQVVQRFSDAVASWL